MTFATKAPGMEPARTEGEAPKNLNELQKGDIFFNREACCIMKITQRLEKDGKLTGYAAVYKEIQGDENAANAQNADAKELDRLLYMGGAPGGTAKIEGETLRIGNLAFSLSDLAMDAPAEKKSGITLTYVPKVVPPRIMSDEEINEGVSGEKKPGGGEVQAAGEPQEAQPVQKDRNAVMQEMAGTKRRELAKTLLPSAKEEVERKYALKYSELRGKEAIGGGLSEEEKAELGKLYDAMDSRFKLKGKAEENADVLANLERKVGELLQKYVNSVEFQNDVEAEMKKAPAQTQPAEKAAGPGEANAPEEKAAETSGPEIIEDKRVMDTEMLVEGNEAGEIANGAAKKVIMELKGDRGNSGESAYGINLGEVYDTTAIRIGVEGLTIGYDNYKDAALLKRIKNEIAAELGRRERGTFDGEDLSLGVNDRGEPVIALNKPKAKE